LIVSLHALQTARALAGPNLSDLAGFRNLAGRVFGPNIFLNTTWTDLSSERQLDVQELLSFFVFSSSALFKTEDNAGVTMGAMPFSSVEVLKYEELFKKLKKKLLNEKNAKPTFQSESNFFIYIPYSIYRII